MSSISIGVVRVRTTVEQVVVIEDLGKEIVRWGLVVVLAWIGGMKFTAYERRAFSRWSRTVRLSIGCTISSACDRSPLCSVSSR
jgi:hypothetical protein